jgi:hypothetical protein
MKSGDEEEEKSKTGQTFFHRWLADPNYRKSYLV